MPRPLLIILGIAISALLLALALRDVEFTVLGEALKNANLLWSLPFLLTLFAFYWLKSVRWRDLLSRKVASKASELFPIVMIGYAGTAVLPMQMGEFVRAYIAAKKYQVSYSLPLSSIVMERIFDLLTILALLAGFLVLSDIAPMLLVRAGYIIGALTLVGLSIAGCLVWFTEPTIQTVRKVLNPLPRRFGEPVIQQLRAAADGASALRSPQLIGKIALNSLAQWALMGLCIWCSLAALDLNVSLSGVVLVLIATIVGISMPTSPGYVGNIQFAFVVALEPFGVSAVNAIAASVFYHVLAYAVVVLLGFTFLQRMGFSLRQLKNEAQSSVKRAS